MAKLKVYLRTNGNIQEQAETYAKVFEGQVLKKSFINQQSADLNIEEKTKDMYSFSYVQLINDSIKVLIAKHYPQMPDFGYQSDVVIALDDQEQYLRIIDNLENNENFTKDYGPQRFEYAGGISLCKFYDKWGYGWILEIKL